MSKVKSGIILGIIVLLTAILAVLEFASFPIPGYKNGIKDYNSIGSTIGLGIDLKGGYAAVLTPKYSDSQQENIDELFDSAVDILRTRLDNKGYTEAIITIQGVGDDREIRIEIPEVEDADEILSIIGSSGKLSFEDESGVPYLEGEHIENCYAGYDQNGQPIVVLEFTAEGTKKFSQATQQLSGKTMYIKLGDDIISSPKVNEQITSASAQIEGIETYEQAETIAAVIKAGRLDFEFEIGSSNKISATLGENALPASVVAGGIGLLIIFALMIVFYRGMGIAASLALALYTVLFILLLALVPWVELTLPGIAGIILSIGMAVDANVIIFERIKEEFESGKTATNAIRTGFKRAFVTIFDSNITTVLASIVLWILCPGSIKGFAITLLLGIVLSMFTAIVVSRLLVNIMYNLSGGKASFLGLKKEVLFDEED
ncbi:MAG: protein translocase subunit SecD [Clostridiales bacterium]|nr:protein translocase subunit SecD [Clostridiales bacterium]